MSEVSTFVGLDVHKETIAVAVAEAAGREARSLGTIPNRPESVRKLFKKLGRASDLLVCYEAGPCGCGIQRQLQGMGVACVVVAPSLVPVRPGDQVKTDRRDALKLARLLRAGELTPVWVPDESHETFRDLTRAREAARQDLVRTRHRLSKLLLRLSIRPPEGVRAGTKKHRQWLQPVKLREPAQQEVFSEYVLAMDQAKERIQRLEAEIAEAAKTSQHAPLLAALQTLRGVGLLTAAVLVAELGDLSRFHSPRQLMGYVGLAPSEYSSGGRRQRGTITKTGSSHLRFVLVKAAWHYRHRPAVFGALRQRQKGQPEAVKQIARKAQTRLHPRYWRLLARGKTKQRAVVAVARELLGFIWACARSVNAPEADAGSARLAA